MKNFVVETRKERQRNVSVRYDEHNDHSKKSEPAAHLEKNIEHYFTRRI